MRKPLLFILYGFTMVALTLGASQLFESRVSADAGTCCTYSDVCPGYEDMLVSQRGPGRLL